MGFRVSVDPEPVGSKHHDILLTTTEPKERNVMISIFMMAAPP